MPPVRHLTAILSADVEAHSRPMGADEEQIVEVPGGRIWLPRSAIPLQIVITVSLVVLAGIASTWWAWRSGSVELAAVYAEGFRKVGMPEQ